MQMVGLPWIKFGLNYPLLWTSRWGTSKPSRSSRANPCEVTIFDYSMTEVAKKCLEDDPTLAKIGERLL
jgi:hypothetical protein